MQVILRGSSSGPKRGFRCACDVTCSSHCTSSCTRRRADRCTEIAKETTPREREANKEGRGRRKEGRGPSARHVPTISWMNSRGYSGWVGVGCAPSREPRAPFIHFAKLSSRLSSCSRSSSLFGSLWVVWDIKSAARHQRLARVRNSRSRRNCVDTKKIAFEKRLFNFPSLRLRRIQFYHFYHFTSQDNVWKAKKPSRKLYHLLFYVFCK